MDSMILDPRTQQICIRNPNGVMRAIQAEANKRMQVDETFSNCRPVHCSVLWGPTRTGKSHRIRMKEAREGRAVFVYRRTTKWEGYDGEPTVLFEEFQGSSIMMKRQDDMTLDQMLDVMDKWPMRIRVLYGTAYAKWTHVYFTSNKDPKTWWIGEDPGSVLAFHQRLREGGGIQYIDKREDAEVIPVPAPAPAPSEPHTPDTRPALFDEVLADCRCGKTRMRNMKGETMFNEDGTEARLDSSFCAYPFEVLADQC